MSDAVFFSNRHIRTPAMGLAVGPNDACYYLSAAGPETSCKSIWAALHTNNGHGITAWGWQYRSMKAQGKMRTFWTSIPNTTLRHVVSIPEREDVILVVNPAGADFRLDDVQRSELWKEAYDEILARFFAIVRNLTPSPILPEWTKTVWQRASTIQAYVTRLQAYGDCIAAYEVNLTANWSRFIADMVARKELTW